MNAGKLITTLFALALMPLLAFCGEEDLKPLATASSMPRATAHEKPEDFAADASSSMGQLPSEPIAAPHAVKEELKGAVVAMESKTGKSVSSGELYTAGGDPALLINRHNQRFELSPRAVVELDEQGALRLMRGSVVAESHEEAVVRTAGARVAFIGKALISFDHGEKSTSVFALEGEARLENAYRNDSSLRLQRFHGATLVAGEVLPQLVRQLDVGSVQSWLAGYAWPPARRADLLKEMPGTAVVAKGEVSKHLEDTKIEDYFSSIDTADEFHQPDYYEKKFADPDKVVAEANSKQGAGKTLSPEEAALISLPKTQIDLGFDLGPEFLTAAQKTKELATIGQAPKAARTPASATAAPKLARKTAPIAPAGDPEVNYVLERLRRVRTGNSAVSQAPARERAPASGSEGAVPDPVYDFSQNF